MLESTYQPLIIWHQDIKKKSEFKSPHLDTGRSPSPEKAMAPTPVLLLENPMDGGAWWAAVHGVAKSRTQLSDFPFTFHFHALK